MRYLMVLVVSGLLLACSKNEQQSGEDSMTAKPVVIEVGMDPIIFVQRNGLDSKRNVDRQPAGINFYEIDWNVHNRGQVQLTPGPYAFTIEHALSVMAMEDTQKHQEGLFAFDIGAGLVSTGAIGHDQARLKFTGMLKALLQRGWRWSIHYSSPRLAGAQSYRYLNEDSLYGLDPTYVPNMVEWMTLKRRQSWHLYAAGVFLNITLDRDPQQMDPEKSGTYYLSFELYSAAEHGRRHFDADERDVWQTLWVEEIKKLKVLRYKKEALLKAQDYRINTRYRDPQVHPADPVEP